LQAGDWHLGWPRKFGGLKLLSTGSRKGPRGAGGKTRENARFLGLPLFAEQTVGNVAARGFFVAEEPRPQAGPSTTASTVQPFHAESSAGPSCRFLCFNVGGWLGFGGPGPPRNSARARSGPRKGGNSWQKAERFQWASAGAPSAFPRATWVGSMPEQIPW